MRKIYLIRHGKTRANEEYIYCGWTDMPLSEKGINEIDQFKSEGIYPDISNCRVITSGMVRTEQTLERIYGRILHDIVPDFKEMNFGDFEMYSYEQLKDREDYQTWISGDNMANICPNGESGNIMLRRALDAFYELEETDTVIFTHGGVIAAIMDSLFPKSNKTRFQWQPANAHGYEIIMGGRKALSYKEIG